MRGQELMEQCAEQHNNCQTILISIQASLKSYDKHVEDIGDKISKIFTKIEQINTKNNNMDVAIARLQDALKTKEGELRHVWQDIKELKTQAQDNDNRISKVMAIGAVAAFIMPICAVFVPMLFR